MEKLVTWFKSIFSTLNRFINNKLLDFEGNSKIQSLFDGKNADTETVNMAILMIIDILIVIIFLVIIRKIVGFLYNHIRKNKRAKQNQKMQKRNNFRNNSRDAKRGGIFRQKKYRRRHSGFFSKLLSRLNFKRRKKTKKVKSSNNVYIDNSGNNGYSGYENDYSYDNPDDIYVEQHTQKYKHEKNTDNENTMYIPQNEYVAKHVNTVKHKKIKNGDSQPVNIESETPIYREMPRPLKKNETENECAELEFYSNEKDDSEKTRVFNLKK